MTPMDIRIVVELAVKRLSWHALDKVRLAPRQCRAGRAALGWDDENLAQASGVEVDDIRALERDEPKLDAVERFRLLKAMRAAGVRFTQRKGFDLVWLDREKVPDDLHSRAWDQWGGA